MNRLVRMISDDGTLYVLAVDSTQMIKEMRDIHHTSKVCSAALGRLLTGAAMMGVLLKGKDDTLTLKMAADGPASPVVAVAHSDGRVKGYIGDANVSLPLNEKGKLDVSSAIGRDGTLTVLKDLGLKEPYSAQIPLTSGEVAEDITAYYAISEQTPTVCGLGVLVNPDDESILCSGGFLIQLLPTADEECISKVEAGLKYIRPVTSMLADGMSPEEICKAVLPQFNLELLDEEDVRYKCDCSRERVTQALISSGRDGLSEMVQDESTEAVCHFCNTRYKFSKKEIQRLLDEISR
ncbi:MAG: Hsp33 family molecular chaperone HslO [Clostridiales bacterium]|nr:Hsp33 family molecular chaperone HslO [Clostridiales bacterium]